jgi:hypothetical protein
MTDSPTNWIAVSLSNRDWPRRATAVVALLALLCGPTPAQAQRDTPSSPLAVFELADRQDWLLRTTLEDGGVVSGRVRDIDGTVVRLEGGRFDVADVASVERGERTGGGGTTGAWVGAGAITAGLILLVLAGGVPPIGDGPDGILETVAALGLAIASIAAIGAVVGGMIGAAMSPSETEWQPLWPADASLEP